MDKSLQKLLIDVGIAALASLALLLVRIGLFRYFTHWIRKTGSPLGLTSLTVLRGPSVFWCVAAGLYVAIARANLPAVWERDLNETLHILLIFSVTLAASNLAAAFFKNLMRTQGKTTGLATGIVRATIFGLGILAALSVLGISIAPILTALGVGGLAVALALKDTLENLFGGVYLLTDRTIRVGDFVRLDTGQEGSIEDISWRTTKVKTPANSTIIVPNSKLAQSVVTNYSLPEQRIAVSLPISVHSDSDPQKVEEILLSIVKKGTEDIVGVLSSPEPCVRFNNSGPDGSLNFNVNFSVRNFSDQSFALHELKKRMLRELKTSGILMPQTQVYIFNEPINSNS